MVALLADLEKENAPAKDTLDDVPTDVPPGVVHADAPTGDSTCGDVHVDFADTSSSALAPIASGTSGDDLEDALRAVNEYLAGVVDAHDRGPEDDLADSAVPPDAIGYV